MSDSPGRSRFIEHQEFEYVRHGTVNALLFGVVHTGRMQAMILPSKDGPHYQAALETFRAHHQHLRGVFLIQDGDPSHTAAATTDYFREHH